MKYYFISEIEVTDRSWVGAYVANVTKLVEQRGGRFLARTARIETVEGERSAPRMLAMIEWPSEKAAKDFYESEEYQPFRKSRVAGSNGWLLMVPGEDVTGTAQISS